MGGQRKEENVEFPIEILSKSIEAVSEKDEKRARDVASFYSDYKRSIENISEILKRGGYACYVVGNRRVKGITLPNDEITVELFRANGFEHVETIVRKKAIKKMTLEQRSALAKKASQARWGKMTPQERKEFCKMMRERKEQYARGANKKLKR